MAGPAAATRNRCHFGLDKNSYASPVMVSLGVSPAIFTYPPKRNALMR